jgi:hypothetical protein
MIIQNKKKNKNKHNIVRSIQYSLLKLKNVINGLAAYLTGSGTLHSAGASHFAGT